MAQKNDELLKQANHSAHIGDINQFSAVEHTLSSRIWLKATDEENDFFDKFYLMQCLSRICLHNSGLLDNHESSLISNYLSTAVEQQWLILWKGPFSLAHTDYIEEFLFGLSKIHGAILPTIVCIDQPLPTTRPYRNIKTIDLYKLNGTKEKLIQYKKLATNYSLAIWIACSQNMSLYMGNRFCRKEAFWSMKHLKMRPGSLDLLLCGGLVKGIREDGPTKWNYGASCPFSLRLKSKKLIELSNKEFKNHKQIYSFGVGVRSEKLSNPDYVKSICKILVTARKACFIIATDMDVKTLNNLFYNHLDADNRNCLKRIKCVGWLNEHSILEFLSQIDCYLDTFPMGSGLMGMYTVFLRKTYIGLSSAQTNKSSFAGALNDLKRNLNGASLNDFGLAENEIDYVKLAINSYNSHINKEITRAEHNQAIFVRNVVENLRNYQMAEDFWSIIKGYII